VETVGGLDASGLEELPNELGPLGPVIIEGFVGPLTGDQDAAPGNT
jgi:hypothetical protein